MKQRYNVTISYKIVLATNTREGKLISQIKRTSGVPHTTLYEYLPHLTRQKLVQKLEQPNKHSRYKITTKGIHFLLAFEKTLCFLKDTKNINTT